MTTKLIVFDVDGTLSPFNKSCEDFRASEEVKEQKFQRDQLVKLILQLKETLGIKFYVITRCSLKKNIILNDDYYSPIVKAVGAKNVFGAARYKDISPADFKNRFDKLSKIKKIKLNRLIWAYKKTEFIKTLCEEHKIIDTSNAVLIDDDGMNTYIAYKNGISTAHSSLRHVGIDYSLNIVKTIAKNGKLDNQFSKYFFQKDLKAQLKLKSTEESEKTRIKKNLQKMSDKLSKRPHLRNTIKELQTECSLFESIIEDIISISGEIKLNNVASFG